MTHPVPVPEDTRQMPAVPRRRTSPIWLVLLVLMALGGLFYLGYVPRQKREAATVAAAEAERRSVPVVNVAPVKSAAAGADLVLPGNVQGIAETPVYARAEGYIRKRYVDIGDRVQAGQVLVEIDTPELDQQVRLSRARLAQSKASLLQAQAGEKQSSANLRLAESTWERWRPLVEKGVLSKQEGDDKRAQFEARQADLQAVQANVSVSQENVRAAEAEVERLSQVSNFKNVTAPFKGIITVRNCAVGNLITPAALATGRELFRLADNSVLRVFVTVPESMAPSIRVGQLAELSLQEFRDRRFTGKVARLANALDAASRTMLTEVQVQNPDGTLFPGMYAQVRFPSVKSGAAMTIPGDTLVTRSDGQYVAAVGPDRRVHFRKVQVGRDYGTQTEILGGLQGNESLVENPGDDVREGALVQIAKKGAPGE